MPDPTSPFDPTSLPSHWRRCEISRNGQIPHTEEIREAPASDGTARFILVPVQTATERVRLWKDIPTDTHCAPFYLLGSDGHITSASSDSFARRLLTGPQNDWIAWTDARGMWGR
jgi:hypothetical protein